MFSQISRHNPKWLTRSCTISGTWVLTHCGRVTYICVNNLTIIGSDNGLSPDRHQAIIWTIAGILLAGPLGTNFSEILIGIQTFSFTKMHWNMSSAKWRPFVSASMCWYWMSAMVVFQTSSIMTTRVPKARIKGRDKQLQPTETVGCNYFSLPLMPAFWHTSLHMILWDVITCPCPLYTLLAHKSSRDTVGCNYLSLPLMPAFWHTSLHMIPWASYQICKIAGCACAGNAGNVFRAIAGERSRHASRHVRHARAVMHVGIAN